MMPNFSWAGRDLSHDHMHTHKRPLWQHAWEGLRAWGWIPVWAVLFGAILVWITR